MNTTDLTHDSTTGDDAASSAVSRPNPASDEVRRLDRLVGTWRITGEATGTVTYRWLPGGHFLIQEGELELFGHRNTFTEIIGREKPFGGQPSTDIKSRAYTAEGDTLDYVYEVDGDTLTIWGGEKGSSGYFRGHLEAGDRRLGGSWVWPGGGYAVTMTRVG